MKRKSLCLLISLIMLLCTACSLSDIPFSVKGVETAPKISMEPIPEVGEEELFSEMREDTLLWKIEEAEPSSEEYADAKANSFYYDRLSNTDKRIYKSILDALLSCEKAAFDASCLDSLDRVFTCVMNDHPEIFYVYGYTCTKEFLGDKLQQVYLEGTKNVEKDEIAKRKSTLEQKTNSILADLAGVTDPYEITKYIYKFIIDNTEYDLHAVDNQNICSVFLNGKSVCQGYAKAFQYLLQKMGIQAALVQGTVQDGGSHAWNIVQLDGEYYYVDVTWGDASYSMANENKVVQEKKLGINYDYMCVTTSEICKTHWIDPIVNLPICVAEKDNYYRREGFYFTDVDDAGLQAAFSKEYEKESESITLKCSDASVYNEMCNYLLEEQKIFSYLQNGGGSVNYANNDAMCTISFWL